MPEICRNKSLASRHQKRKQRRQKTWTVWVTLLSRNVRHAQIFLEIEVLIFRKNKSLQDFFLLGVTRLREIKCARQIYLFFLWPTERVVNFFATVPYVTIVFERVKLSGSTSNILSSCPLAGQLARDKKQVLQRVRGSISYVKIWQILELP